MKVLTWRGREVLKKTGQTEDVIYGGPQDVSLHCKVAMSSVDLWYERGKRGLTTRLPQNDKMKIYYNLQTAVLQNMFQTKLKQVNLMHYVLTYLPQEQWGFEIKLCKTQISCKALEFLAVLIHQLQCTFLFYGQRTPPPLAYCDSELSLEQKVLRGVDLTRIWGFRKDNRNRQ